MDISLYAVGCAHLQVRIDGNEPLQQTLEYGVRYCVFGATIAFLAVPFVLFLHGWKRLPLIIGGLILVPLFVGLTLY
jgi:hypothetical protein